MHDDTYKCYEQFVTHLIGSPRAVSFTIDPPDITCPRDSVLAPCRLGRRLGQSLSQLIATIATVSPLNDREGSQRWVQLSPDRRRAGVS